MVVYREKKNWVKMFVCNNMIISSMRMIPNGRRASDRAMDLFHFELLTPNSRRTRMPLSIELIFNHRQLFVQSSSEGLNEKGCVEIRSSVGSVEVQTAKTNCVIVKASTTRRRSKTFLPIETTKSFCHILFSTLKHCWHFEQKKKNITTSSSNWNFILKRGGKEETLRKVNYKNCVQSK